MLLQSQHLETLPILERRIRELAEENKKLHAEATELANEAKVSFIICMQRRLIISAPTQVGGGGLGPP